MKQRLDITYEEFVQVIPYARRTFDNYKISYGVNTLIEMYEILKMRLPLSKKKRIFYDYNFKFGHLVKDNIFELYITKHYLESDITNDAIN